jgi:hypothetical protein
MLMKYTASITRPVFALLSASFVSLPHLPLADRGVIGGEALLSPSFAPTSEAKMHLCLILSGSHGERCALGDFLTALALRHDPFVYQWRLTRLVWFQAALTKPLKHVLDTAPDTAVPTLGHRLASTTRANRDRVLVSPSKLFHSATQLLVGAQLFQSSFGLFHLRPLISIQRTFCASAGQLFHHQLSGVERLSLLELECCPTGAVPAIHPLLVHDSLHPRHPICHIRQSPGQGRQPEWMSVPRLLAGLLSQTP